MAMSSTGWVIREAAGCPARWRLCPSGCHRALLIKLKPAVGLDRAEAAGDGRESPESERLACQLSGANAHIDEVGRFAQGEPGADGEGDGAAAAGCPADIGEGSAGVSVPLCPFGAVLRVGTEAEVGGVGAAVGVAAVAEDGVLGTRPVESGYDPVGELVGEQVGGDCSASRCPRQARCPVGPVSGGADRGEPGPALLVAPGVALGLEAVRLRSGPPASSSTAVRGRGWAWVRPGARVARRASAGPVPDRFR